jgi:hypothetical protein
LNEETWLWFQLIVILNGLYLALRVRREKGKEREREREREKMFFIVSQFDHIMRLPKKLGKNFMNIFNIIYFYSNKGNAAN